MVHEFKAKNGEILGSDRYFTKLNKQYLNGISSLGNGYTDYYRLYSSMTNNFNNKRYAVIIQQYSLTKQTLKKLFEPIALMIKKDLSYGTKETYIKDENAQRLKKVLYELKQCKVSGLDNVIKSMQQFCWFIDVDKMKVSQLQTLLVELGYGPLGITGIYDAKTDKTFIKFVQSIIDNGNAIVNDMNMSNMVFMEGYNITKTVDIVDKGIESVPRKILEELKNVKVSSIVGKADKFISISTKMLQALQLGVTIQEDLNDADKKLGKDTIVKISEIAGYWGALTVGAFASAEITGVLMMSMGPLGLLVAAPMDYVILVIVPDGIQKLSGYLGEKIYDGINGE